MIKKNFVEKINIDDNIKDYINNIIKENISLKSEMSKFKTIKNFISEFFSEYNSLCSEKIENNNIILINKNIKKLKKNLIKIKFISSNNFKIKNESISDKISLLSDDEIKDKYLLKNNSFNLSFDQSNTYKCSDKTIKKSIYINSPLKLKKNTKKIFSSNEEDLLNNSSKFNLNLVENLINVQKENNKNYDINDQEFINNKLKNDELLINIMDNLTIFHF